MDFAVPGLPNAIETGLESVYKIKLSLLNIDKIKLLYYAWLRTRCKKAQKNPTAKEAAGLRKVS